jgi:hypothetical protein
MASTPPHAYQDPAYLLGQIHATQAMVLAVARLTLDAEEFRKGAAQRLELLRTAALPEPIPEAYLRAVDDAQAFLNRQIEQGE